MANNEIPVKETARLRGQQSSSKEARDKRIYFQSALDDLVSDTLGYVTREEVLRMLRLEVSYLEDDD